MVDCENIRLHISPFSEEIYPLIIPPTSTRQPQNVSYHSLQTFPENSYGFLELPRSEAEKMKKKLNGSILKGRKIHIEEARPRKRQRTEPEEDLHSTERLASKQEEKPLPAHSANFEGHELPADRKVKRGWTEPKRKDGKRKANRHSGEATSSKYSEHEECLFNTKLPPNRSPANDKRPPKKNKEAKDSRKAVVHEFKKSQTHPTFLRGKDAAPQRSTTANFVEGIGWVDQSGKLVEEDPKVASGESKRPKKRVSSNQQTVQLGSSNEARRMVPNQPAENGNDYHSSEADARSDTSSSSATDDSADSQRSSTSDDSVDDDEDTSSEGSLSDSAVEETTSLQPGAPHKSALRNVPDTADVHPLEALFKRPQSRPSSSANKPSLEIKTSFNFFESNPEEDLEAHNPTTPFTRKDMLVRGQRSAAPTPDTAAPTKIAFSRSEIEPQRAATSTSGDGQNDKRDSATDLKEPKSTTSEGEKADSSFTKWFWENRGENNRTWKRLRREAAKEKRQKENRRSRLNH